MAADGGGATHSGVAVASVRELSVRDDRVM
jgi:hypothetical protein